jgi:hypothetical protein
MGLRPRGYCKRVLEGVLSACSLRARATKGTPDVPQCAHTFHPSMVRVRILETSLATHTHRPVLRRYAHGGGRGTSAVLAHTASRSALSEYARTMAQHGTAAPFGYYPFSQRAWRVLAGDSRAYGNRVRWGGVRARAAPGASDAVLERQSEPWSVLLTTRTVLGGYSRGTHGTLRGMTCAGQWKGTCGAVATGTHRVRAREGVLRTIPSTPRRWATAGGCCRGTRGHVRRGYAQHSATVRAGTRSGAYGQQRARARSLARARRGIAHAAGAQGNKLLELRQSGRDRAVQRVRGESPATCMVYPAVQCNAYAPVRATHSHPHSTRWPHASSSERVLDTGTQRGCCTCAFFVPGRRKVLQACRSAHTPSMVLARILERSLATRYRVSHGAGPLRGAATNVLAATCGEGTRTAVRRCVQAHAAVLTDTNGHARSHAGARRGNVRAAGAQETQLTERRQRGGDRAVQRVRVESPATCMVRPTVQ